MTSKFINIKQKNVHNKFEYFFLIVILLFQFNKTAKGMDSTYEENLNQFKMFIESVQKESYQEGLDFSEKMKQISFKSKEYFYFYKAHMVLQILKRGFINDNKKILKLLQKGYSWINMAKNAEGHKFQKKVTHLYKEYLIYGIDLLNQQKNFFMTIDFIEKLSLFSPLSSDHLLIYLLCLIETKQYTLANQIFNQYSHKIKKVNISSLPSTKLRYFLQKKFKTVISIKMDKKRSKKDQLQVAILKQHQKELSPKDCDLLAQTIVKYFYLKDIEKKFSYLLHRYINGLKKHIEKRNKVEKNLIKSIENNINEFPPIILYQVGHKLWDNFQIEKGIELFKIIARKYPSFSKISNVYHFIGRMHEDLNQYQIAIKYFREYTKKFYDHPYLDQSFFHIAWSHYLNKNYQKALKYFREYYYRFDNGKHTDASKYFAIKIYLSMNKIDQANNLINDLLEKSPLSYYTLLILHRRKKEYPFQKKEKAVYRNKQIKKTISTQSKLRKYNELYYVGLYDDASDLLVETIKDNSDPEYINYLVNEFKNLKVVDKYSILYMRLFSYAPNRDKSLIKNFFPALWKNEIIDTNKKLNVSYPYFLIMSLIRQESAFAVKAISSANALGLMQVIPSTAKINARRLKLKRYNLFNPRDNILLGIKTFKDEMQKFDNKIYLALCAYNAGPTNAKRWDKVRKEMTPEEFIESIPFEETRTYVKTIIRNYLFYNMVHSEQTLHKIDIPFIL